MNVTLELTEDEAEWLSACMGMVMQISGHWASRTADDTANAVLNKLNLAALEMMRARSNG
jgi:hypothetical protein